MIKCWICFLCISLLTACAGVNTAVCEYKLDKFSPGKISEHPVKQSLLVSTPSVGAGYDTERMLYMASPYSLQAFAKNAWISTPGNMLYPLILQSLQKSHYFAAVIGSNVADSTDYRLDTHVIAFHQNFIEKPSSVELIVQAVLTHVETQRIVASRIFVERVACANDTPYAGVVAANQAALQLTAELSDFVRL